MKKLFFLAWVGGMLMLSPTMGEETQSKKVYQWQHPWFKNTIKSNEPPAWPYKIISEKNNIIFVTVTPPNAEGNKPVPSGSALQKNTSEDDEGKKKILEQQAEERRIAAEKEAAARQAEEQRIAAEKAKEEAQKEARKNEVKRKIVLAKEKIKDDKDIEFFLNIIDEFIQYEKFAASTPRINLAIPLNNLLATKRKLDTYEMASCYADSKKNLQTWMELIIRSYYEFSGKNELESAKYRDAAIAQFDFFWISFPESC